MKDLPDEQELLKKDESMRVVVFIFFASLFMACSSGNSSTRVELLPANESTVQTELLIAPVFSPGHLDLFILNRTDSDIELYELWNSWGHDTIAIEVAGASAPTEIVSIRDAQGIFSPNVPSTKTIKAGESGVLVDTLIKHEDRGLEPYEALRKKLQKQGKDSPNWFVRVRLKSSNNEEELKRDKAIPRVWEGEAVSDWVLVRDFESLWKVND